MWIKIAPTEEMYHAPINGGDVPCRVWTGSTEGGVQIDCYVLSVVPLGPEYSYERFVKELPAFMKPTRNLMEVADAALCKEEKKS